MPNPHFEELKAEGKKYGWGIILIREAELKQVVQELLSKFPKVKVLDVGSWVCYLGGWFKHNFGERVEYVGIDVVDVEGRLKEFEFYIMSGESLLFPPNSFELVTFIESLEHIPNYVLALKEAFRVLKPGGAVFIQSIRSDRPNAVVAKTHFHVLHPVTLARLLRWLGFNPVHEVNKENFAVVGFKPRG